MNPLTQISPGRRRKDKIMRGLIGVATLIALVPLVLVIFYIVSKGLKGITAPDFFTSDPTGRACFPGQTHCPPAGGIQSAILGTLEMVGLAALISIPIGIAVAVWLVEYGKTGWFAGVIRYLVDVMTGVPSIVFGLFIFIVLIQPENFFGQEINHGYFGGFAGWKGALALSLLMLPIVTRSAEVVLNLVPDGLREGALALGAPRWRVIVRIVLPTALSGLITGSLLAVARAAGETAPLLFTAFYVKDTNFNLSDPMNSLPSQIFNDVRQAQDRLVDRAWGAALTLVAMILILNLVARLISRRSRLA